MTFEQISSAIRTVGAYVVAYLAGKGVIAEADAAVFITAFIAVAHVAYTMWNNRKAAIVTKAANLEGVKVEVSKSQSPGTANATKDVDGVTVTR